MKQYFIKATKIGATLMVYLPPYTGDSIVRELKDKGKLESIEIKEYYDVVSCIKVSIDGRDVQIRSATLDSQEAHTTHLQIVLEEDEELDKMTDSDIQIQITIY